MSAKADFGTELAISTRTELDPGDRITLAVKFVYLLLFIGIVMVTNTLKLSSSHHQLYGGSNMVSVVWSCSR